jgi:hypothetical protein
MMADNQLPTLLKAITQAENHLRDLRTRRDGIAAQLAETDAAIETLKTARQAYITGEKGAKPVDPGAIPTKRLEAEGLRDDLAAMDTAIAKAEHGVVFAEMAAEQCAQRLWTPIEQQAIQDLRHAIARLGVRAWRATAATGSSALTLYDYLKSHLTEAASLAEAQDGQAPSMLDAPLEGVPKDLPEIIPTSTLIGFPLRRQLRGEIYSSGDLDHV